MSTGFLAFMPNHTPPAAVTLAAPQHTPDLAALRGPKLTAKRSGSGYVVSLTTADGAHFVSVFFTVDQFAQAIGHLIAVETKD